MSWTTVQIGDLGRIVTGKTPPTKQRQYYDGEYPFITPSDLDYDSFRVVDTVTTLSGDAKSKFASQFLPKNAVAFTCIASVGKIGVTATDSLTNQQINSIVVSDEHDWRFVYYLLRHESRRIQSMCSGVAVPIINKGDFERINIRIPNSLMVEQRIASILFAYDELIENNRRRIRLLEQAARLLYKEWFVHLRFPGHDRITVTNGVPDGWKKEKVSAHVDFVRGVEPGSKNYMQVSDEMLVPFLRVGDFGNRISNIFIDAAFAEGNMLKPEDVAITMDGTPGLVGFGMTGAFSSGIRKVVPKDNCGIGWSFIYTLLKSESIQATVARFAKGTTILHASSSIDHMVFLRPHQGILDVFEDVAGSLLRQVLLLEQQNRKLVKARDLLLPRLMSGAVTV